MGDNTVKVTGYEIGCLLGQGTQGCVYKAITRGPERKPVAVKVVQKSRLSKVGRDNLVTEIGLLKQLKHRFILELVFSCIDQFQYASKDQYHLQGMNFPKLDYERLGRLPLGRPKHLHCD